MLARFSLESGVGPDYTLDVGSAVETVLITGASRGIGAEAARRLAAPHRRLLLVARGERALAAQCREIEGRGGMAVPLAADMGQAEALEACIESIDRRYGPLDGLILNAAIANDRDFQRSCPSLLERELATNYLAPAKLLLHFLPPMAERSRGKVVVVGSLTSIVPFPGNASYSASKAALATLIRSLRVEYRGCGVELGVVLPGYTDTAMTRGTKCLLRPMSAAAVGRAVANCYERPVPWVIPGAMNRMAALMFGAFPTTADRVMGRFFKFLVPTPT